MLFNAHQSKIWFSMIKSIADFRKGELRYFDLVYNLEGALDAGEFEDSNLLEEWYIFWTPLEILYAVKGNSVTAKDANKYIADMESFLKRTSRSTSTSM